MQLDAGGIAKGFAADRALRVLVALGVPRAIVAAGGDIAIGDPPPDRSGWEIALAGLDNAPAPGSPLSLSHAGVSTSGDAEQWVEIGGVRYSHILDPRTGQPITGRSSVTVVAGNATTSDMLATAVDVLGPEAGRRLVDGWAGASALIGTRDGAARRPLGDIAEISMRRMLALTMLAAAAVGVATRADTPNTLTAQEKADGWVLLFDGSTTAGWHGYNQTTMPEGWAVKDGALTRVGKATDIASDKEYASFDFKFDWKIAQGGNSGVMYHVVESPNYKSSYFTGPEYQLLDNLRHPDAKAGKDGNRTAGSDYDLYPPSADVTKPAGEWNESRIVIKGSHVEHWMNGKKLLEYELWSDAWKAQVAASKFKAWPDYGLAKSGHIVLQEHEAEVAFRNIKIKVL